MSGAQRDPSEVIAVVGMAGRFPGAGSIEQFWANLCRGVESISSFTEEELALASVPTELSESPEYVRAGSVLEGIEGFDAELFGFSPREAEILDPQLRVFLECAWEGLERAGMDPERWDRPIGIYAGVSMNTYLLNNLLRNPRLLAATSPLQLRILNDKDFLTTWVSYRLNLRGPSVAVQTACSTSLVAVHMACQSLLGFECDAALAGGVAISVPQRRGYLYEEGSIYSPDGHCRPFDAAAKGTVSGSGAGLVVLKRLEDALAEGHPIHAVIRGSAVNNDGRQKMGFMAPSVDSQSEAIASAQSLAETPPDTIGLIEAHGTGTPLGDPIEISALARVFREGTDRRGFCAVGSVKSNIGHLDQAAGVAGLIKAVLAVEHGLIPPSLHYQSPNPEIDFANSPFYVNTELTPWRSNGHLRRAGVSSFGVGGTNAHVVLEQGPARELSGPSRDRALLLFSARTPAALDALTANLGKWLDEVIERGDRPALADVAFTLQVGRRELAERRALVCASLEDAAAALSGRKPGRLSALRVDQERRGVAFLFPGQGSQYPGMGFDLYRSESVFRTEVDRCCTLLEPRLGFDLRRFLYPGLSGNAPDPDRLAQTSVAQPALFVVEYALAKLWMEWGIAPRAMIGHSVGEYVAACLAGVFTLEDALAVVAARGRLMQGMPRGAMLSVGMAEAELAPLLGGRLSLAAVNGSRLCVAAGPEAEVEVLQRNLEERGIEARRLHTSHAFHSSLMEPALAAFTDAMERIDLRAPEIPFISCVTGTWITDAEATDPAYWARQLRQTVRFADGVATLRREVEVALLEVGPGRTLATFVRAAAKEESAAEAHGAVTALRHARDESSDIEHLLGALGRLWMTGVSVDWAGFYAQEKRRREVLPTYPFDRTKYWVEPTESPAQLAPVSEEVSAGAESSGHHRPAIATRYEEPRTELEQAVAGIWQELLGIREIGIHDDFFELGGHSLMASQVISRIRGRLGVSLEMPSLFESPTVAQLGALIEQAQGTGISEEVAVPWFDQPERKDSVPTSFTQERLWFLDRLEGGSAAYNLPMAVEVRGELRAEALAAALNEVVRRHDALRTRFEEVDGVPVQSVSPARVVAFPTFDLVALPESVRGDEAARLGGELVHRPFDLEQGPLFKAHLVRVAPRQHGFLVVMHHIISDGWSIGVFVREIATLYDVAVRGVTSPLPDLPLQYPDFAVWQRQWLTGERLDRRLAVWRDRLAGAPAGLDLPTDRPYPPAQTFQGESLPWRLEERATSDLRALCRAEGVTLFTLLMAGYFALLHRYSGAEDLMVGTPVAGRDRQELESLIGLFMNTLALRGDLSGEPTFREVLRRVREVVLEAQTHADLPFEKLVEELRPVRDLARPPVFQTLLALQNLPWSPIELPGVVLAPMAVESRTAKYELIVWIHEAGKQLSGSLEHNTDLFDRSTVVQMGRHFATLLAVASAELGARIVDLPLLDEAERAQLERDWNGTQATLAEWTVPTVFAAQVKRLPDAVALTFGDHSVSYGELGLRVDRLARRLRSLGIGPEGLVGVALERSIEMVVSVLAVLRAGGAYLPLDPEYPAERLAYMLNDSGVRILLTEGRAAESLPAHDAKVVRPGEITAERHPEGGSNLGNGPEPENLCYVLYTSGSTGRPKGVQVPHGSLANFLVSMRREPGLECGERFLTITSLSFDIAALELFLPLVVGGSVELVGREEAGDGLLLSGRLERSTAVGMQATPATWHLLVAADWAGRPGFKVLCGGEALPSALADKLRNRADEVWNLYGPTETTVWSAVSRVDEGLISLGRPIANTSIHVLDRALRAAPFGVAGELYIGGAGLVRGYLGRPDLTAERFVPDPFGGFGPGGRLYRTGDLARRRTDGRLEFLGRLDHQVKVRGFRIELGEIEAALSSHPGVRASVVVAWNGVEAGSKRLVGYVVPAGDTDLGATELRQAVRERLPEYMVPSDFVVLGALPLTPNGKVDRKALPAPAALSDVAFRAPTTQVEELLAEIWADVLRRGQIGKDDDFFALGGHSLLAAQVASRLRKRLGVEIPIRTLFERPRMESLAAEVARLLQITSPAPESLLLSSGGVDLPLSFAQERLWFLDRLEPGQPTYNLPMPLWIEGPLRVGALRAAFAALTRRHESLRTIFPVSEGRPSQRILPDWLPLVGLVDLAGLPELERQPVAVRLVADDARRPFDLARGPLLRASLLRLARNRHVLLLSVHHIVCDDWSSAILASDLAALYQSAARGMAPSLPDLPIQYADYGRWHRKWLNSGILDEQLGWWKQRLAGHPGAIDLPSDRPRPPAQSGRGAQLPVFFGADLARGLARLARELSATPFILLYSVFLALLHRYTGRMDLALGTPVANRNQMETERLIGLFVNTLVLRLDLSGNPEVRELVARARESVLDGFARQDLPFERLVQELLPQRDLSRSPVFDVMLTLQNAPRESIEVGDLAFRPLTAASGTAKFDLELLVWERPDSVEGYFEYATDLFDAATIQRMAEHLRNLAAGAIAHPGLRIANLPLLGRGERAQIQAEWNDAAVALPAAAAVHRLFEGWARQRPDTVAVCCGDEHLSYGELDARANRLAAILKAERVGTDSVVALLAERGLSFLIAVLAVHKSGGAYLPLDLQHPPERTADVLRRSGSRLVLAAAASNKTLVSPALAELAERERPRVSLLEDLLRFDGAARVPELRAEPDSLAYVIYTSGSTGAPKGAMVTHRGMLNHLWAKVLDLQLSDADVVAQTASQCFDISVWQFLAPLVVGGRVQIFPDEVAHDPERLATASTQHDVTVLETVPSLLGALLAADGEPGNSQNLSPLRWMLATGEALPPQVCERWFHAFPDCPLLNAYGPTECSDDVAHFVMSSPLPAGTTRVPIGRPIANTQLYVADFGAGLVPALAAGELWVGGRGVGRGYLGDPARTAEVFVPDPFGGDPGSRSYRTGDLVRWLPDGAIEFLGRMDHQVKIRGFRIELGEIEVALAALPGVREAVVVASGAGGGELRLVAYVAPRPDAVFDARAAEASLRRRLPDYMVPAVWVVLADLPLTANGKIDRRALPDPEPMVGERAAAPEAAVEQMLAAIWCEVLGLESVGRGDDFFALGGHSLLATQIASRVRSTFAVELPLQRFFETPVLADLAALMRSALTGSSGDPPSRLVPGSRPQRLALSFAQERIWFADQMVPGNPAYNIPAAVRLYGALSSGSLKRALEEVVRRHEVLRTTFPALDGVPFQEISPALSLTLPLVDLGALPLVWQRQELGHLSAEQVDGSFDLLCGPLLRSCLARLGPEDHVLFLTLHHIVSDGWSQKVLVEEISELYPAYVANEPSRLPELPLQYADYALWQREWLHGETLERLLGYWTGRLGGELPAFDFPFDRPRPALPSWRASFHAFHLDAELARAIDSLSRQERTTPAALFLAAFAQLLHFHSGAEDLLIGAPIAGRHRTETEGLIGVFLNTVVLRIGLAGDPGFSEILARVRGALLGADAHQDLPFDRLVSALGGETDPTRSRFYQTWFNFEEEAPARIPRGLRIEPHALIPRRTKFELALNLVHGSGRLGGAFEYSRDLFEPETVARLARQFEDLLRSAVDRREAKLSEVVESLAIAERHRRLEQAHQISGALHSRLKSIKRSRTQLSMAGGTT